MIPLPSRAALCGLLFFLVAAPLAHSAESDSASPALIAAARKGDLAAIDLQLAAGADLEFRNNFGETALMNAADAGRTEAVRRLLAAGADPMTPNPKGRTALTFALMSGHTKAAVAIIEAVKDADLLQSLDEYGESYMGWAAGKPSALRALLDRGVPVDLPNGKGRTALSFSAEQGGEKSVPLLLERGADPNLADHAGRTPYYYAASRVRWNEMQLLLAAGAKVMNAPLVLRTYDPKPAFDPVQRWALAAAALLTYLNHESLDHLGGRPAGREMDFTKQRLREWWDVNDRAKLLTTLAWLRDGGHRASYAPALRLLREGTDEQIARVWPLERRNAVRRELGGRDPGELLAWDYCRLINVAAWGAHAGYLTEAEAWEWILPAAAELQSTYGSWKEMSDDYIVARAIWQGKTQERISYIQERFLDPEEAASPWRLAWSTPLLN